MQGAGSSPSDTLMTAMSRLATEHKADRATKDNPHRKRKSAEAFPANNGVGITKLNPNSKILPPLSMGQQTKSASAGPSAQQQPSFQGSLVSAAQPQSSMHRQHSGSQLSLQQPQHGLKARKRVKLEQASAANSDPQAYAQAAASKQTSGSRQTSGTKITAASKQRSGSRQSSDDAQTNTEGASQHMGAHQSNQQLTNDDTVTSAAASRATASLPEASLAQHAPQVPPEQQVSFPFRLLVPKAAHPAVGLSSSALDSHSAAPHPPSAMPAAAQSAQAATQAAGSQPSAWASAVQHDGSAHTASADGDNCMAALAEAAAAASEGSAASSSSLVNSDDDQDAAAILRDLQHGAGRAQHLSPSEGELQVAD